MKAQHTTPIWQWGCLLLLLGSCGMGMLGTSWLLWHPIPPPRGARPTAIIWTTTPAPTPAPTATILPTAQPIEPTPEPITSLALGATVIVTGTGEAGLSLRAAANRNAERLDIAFDGETFRVIGGPLTTERFIWWQIQDIASPQRRGWAAANYLRAHP